MAANLNSAAARKGNNTPQLPIIDLSELDGPGHDKVVEMLAKAAETHGLFQVVNHGLPLQFLDDFKDLVHRFFNQPVEDKAVYQKKFVAGPLVSYTQNPPPELIEVLLMRYTSEEDALASWPDSCKEMALKYRKLSSGLTGRILGALLSEVGVTLDDSMVDAYMGEQLIGLNYYPAWPKKDADVVGTYKHTDNSVLTVLSQDLVGGLYVDLGEDGDMENNYKGEWVEITPIPEALVIIVGDCLQILSNGKYIAGDHYVQTTGEETRVSLTCFMNPRPTQKIGPLAQVVDKDGGKSRFKELLFEEYESYKHDGYFTGLRTIDSLRILSV